MNADSFKLPKALVFGDSYVTVSVSREVQGVISEWLTGHRNELAEVLAPYDIHPFEICSPQYERVVSVDEARRLLGLIDD